MWTPIRPRPSPPGATPACRPRTSGLWAASRPVNGPGVGRDNLTVDVEISLFVSASMPVISHAAGAVADSNLVTRLKVGALPPVAAKPATVSSGASSKLLTGGKERDALFANVGRGALLDLL